MIVKRGKGDFTQVYRPCRISEMVGNDEVKGIIERAFKENKVPHNFLFHGLSGTGKTTIARIIEMGLNCVEGPTSEPCCECDYCKKIINRTGSLAVYEINAVEVLKDGLKKVLSEFDAYNFGSFEGLDKNIFLVDECHGLTDEQAGLFLKYTEDVSERNYFIFCTTVIDAFLDTLRNRCTIQVEFKKVPNEEIMRLLSAICDKENLQHNEDVLKNIVDQSGGMPRNAVNLLQQNYLAGNLKKNRILRLSGKNNIHVIAPHGHPKNDVNTDNLPAIVEAETDDLIVDEAFMHLKKIFQQHFHEAMLKAGQYLIKKFYGNVDDAKDNKKPLLPLIKKLQANSGNAPSKTWVYDAVKLAIDEHDFEDFRTYGNLGHSQKVLLTSVNSGPRKLKLVEEAVEGNYTVAKLRERIRDIKGKNPLSLDENVTDIASLRKLEPPQLLALQTDTQSQINKLFDELNLYQKKLKKISSLINKEENIRGSEQKAKRGFRDWTEPENNINFCTGCENNCVYCYAKFMAYRRGQVKKGHWHEMVIREKDVDNKRKLHKGIVGFPSTHDILPTNIGAYLSVLGKLLRSGNEVLIVSKPRLDCVKRICEATQFFKDKILFRFTIGAMNDDILSYWEPNAPTYNERKACLKYAFHWGFRTSVSMEPMLDSQNIEALVEDLLPFVSDDIWLGTMNHISRIKKGADERLLSELDIVEAGQTPEMLLAIDRTYENNPKIKWKTEALKIIEGAKEKAKGAKKERINKKFKGWEKVNVKAEDGLAIEATAPVIISASRVTDLPAFYGDWFMERLRKGYLVKRFPRNSKKTENISFSNSRLIVFWTKNPEPMFKYLDEIEQMEIGYYFHYTLNDYEGDSLEPNVLALNERIEYFKTLSRRIGKERVIWRFDPLILTDAITKEKLTDKVCGIMTQLSGFTEKLVISFMKADKHKKVVRNLNKAGIKYRDFSQGDIDYLASYLAKMGKQFDIEIAACAEEFDLIPFGIAPNKCIDDSLIRRVFSHDYALMEFIGDGKDLMDMGQRKTCCCIVSKDIGEYHTCKHLCIYCYANVSEKIVNRNVKRITQKGEMLLPSMFENPEEYLPN